MKLELSSSGQMIVRVDTQQLSEGDDMEFECRVRFLEGETMLGFVAGNCNGLLIVPVALKAYKNGVEVNGSLLSAEPDDFVELKRFETTAYTYVILGKYQFEKETEPKTIYVANAWVVLMMSDYENRNGSISPEAKSKLAEVLSPNFVLRNFDNSVHSTGYYFTTFSEKTDSLWFFLTKINNEYLMTTKI